LEQHQINKNDVVIGIAASGTTPYVIGALVNVTKIIFLPQVLLAMQEVRFR
jgi:N-acetylmuramic acid 6-phosphate (MurNAc-6-P) etherase